MRERLVLAKAVREEHQARLAAIEVAEKERALVPADQVAKGSARAGLAFRDAMLSIPGRVAAQLASMDDEREIERFLTTTIRAELTRLADSVLPNAA